MARHVTFPDRKDYARIRVEPTTGALGAEVTSVDLRDIDDETFREIDDAWMTYKVLFFRDQELTTQQHIDYGRRWGELEIHPLARHDADHPEIIVLDSTPERFVAAESWHSDVMFEEHPPLGSILRATHLPPYGGDTVFANMELAYEGLDDETKEAIEGRSALNSFMRKFGWKYTGAELEAKRREQPDRAHPLVRTHPVTGRRSLYCCEDFTVRIVDMDDDESERLLQKLYAQAAIPQYQTRFRWRPGSVAQWDNRCTQHYAVPDYVGAHRRMERVTITGDAPF